MANTGLAELDFGAFPGDVNITQTVTGQADIVSGSVVEVYIEPKDTADHTIDEHIIEAPRVFAGLISVGVGFSIYGMALDDRAYGLWNVRWVWV
jgi:hypothetical protein